MNTNKDFELLCRYLDKELRADELQSVENRLLAEPDLNALYDKLKIQNDKLISEISEIDNIPMSNSLRAVLEGIDEAYHKKTINPFSRWLENIKPYFSSPQTIGLSIACSVIAIVIGINYVHLENSLSDETFAVNYVVPDQIAEFLSRKLTGDSESISNEKLSQKMAFSNTVGSLCKYYTANNSDHVYRVIACFENTRWKNVFALKDDIKTIDSSQLFVPAGDAPTNAINQYLKNNISGAPLSKEEEAHQLENVWSTP